MKKLLFVALFGMLSCAKGQAPAVGAEEITADLHGAGCQVQGLDRLAPGFVVFACVTSEVVDAPHIRAHRMHSPALYVRVPKSDASKFANDHPWPLSADPTPTRDL